MNYAEFLESKIDIAPETGFDVPESQINPALKPHQRDSVRWALKGGRRALFQAFGLGKTAEQLEWARLVAAHGNGRALIVLPLGVKQEFARDAVKLLGWDAPPEYVRSMAEIRAAKTPVMLTNYERMRDGDIDPHYFAGVSLDEASVLRSYGSKTYQEFTDKMRGVRYKLVCTATPSPNKYKELIHYAGYLEIMDTGQALTRFFKRDSTKANNLTLYEARETEFWLWMSTWALFLEKPSDIGYDDDGYALPPITVNWHTVAVDNSTAGFDRDGQAKLIRDAALSLQDSMREKRDSISARVRKAKEIVDENPDDHFILWHDLEDERRAIEETFPTRTYGGVWEEYKDGHSDALALYERHYSAYQYADGRERKLFCGPGEKMVLMTRDRKALFVWRKFIDNSGETGVNCAVFRNEGEGLSSMLIAVAMGAAWYRWPGQRLYTYVNAEKIRSNNPGCCFKAAGWKTCGTTKGGLIVLEALPTADHGAVIEDQMLSIYGSQDLDVREQRTIDFSEGRFRILATKKEISGSGCNFQRHCHRAIFVGIDYEFNDFIQAIHRVYRFLQDRPVVIDIIRTESEQAIAMVLQKKWAQHDRMMEKMTGIIRKYGLNGAMAIERLKRQMGVERVQVKGENFTAINNDCVDETRRMADNSVDLIHTSIPFGNHYEYSANYNDFGHNPDTERFFRQMDYLSPELLRVLAPGRVFACHVKDRVLFGNATGTGMPTMEPFHALCISHYMRHGFQYFGMITVLTDVVRENNQTYRLGWSEQCKDGTKMGVGCPEYILLFRKLPTDTSRAYADRPVTKSKRDYTRARWQIDAHGFWRSSGNRLIGKDELGQIPVDKLQKVYRDFSRETVYDYAEHVALAEKLDADGKLPASFMVCGAGSWTDEVWDDINRMRTLNTRQSQKRQEKHVCPLQLDIVERIINRYSNPGDVVYDPFAGLMTVPERAVRAGRYGIGCELNADYFRDGVGYLQAADAEATMPTLFDFLPEMA